MHFQKYNPNPNLGKKIVDHASEYFLFFIYFLCKQFFGHQKDDSEEH